jgi:hypothetical protein
MEASDTSRSWSANFSRFMLVLLCGLVLVLAGCSDSLESTVSGTLTYGGKAVPFAEIVFHPLDGGPLPYGVSMEDGSYEIMSATTTGLKAGNYIVVVQATSSEVSVPKTYGSVATSTLKYEVKPGKNVINLDLK